MVDDLTRHQDDLTPALEAALPRCPECLEQLEPVVGAWWCQNCKATVRP